VAGVAGCVTLAVPVLPPLQFAWPAPSLHIALETGVALIGVLATAILVGCWRQGPRIDRLALAAGLAVIAIASAVLTTLLAIAPGSGPRAAIALTGTLVGSALLAFGAFAPARRPRDPMLAVGVMAAVTVLSLAAVAMPIVLAVRELPPTPADLDLARPQISGSTFTLALQIAIVCGFATAAIGLTRRGVRGADAVTLRLGLAAVLYSFARLHYLLVPQFGHEFVHTGDLLRLLFCAVLLWAAGGEVARSVGARAAERERRRIARDLHDGVAQELAFIRRRAAALAGDPDAAQIVVAAERALEDSRWAIEDLARAPDEPLDRVLARHAALIAARTGVAVTFSTAGSAAVGPEVSEALARILGEAVTNARHGNATVVHVELSTDPLCLRVIDDGSGFDTTLAAAGFGLGGMRERAALVGAELSVRSGPGAGTEVAVELR
jgi:signal transduction histidine kinase